MSTKEAIRAVAAAAVVSGATLLLGCSNATGPSSKTDDLSPKTEYYCREYFPLAEGAKKWSCEFTYDEVPPGQQHCWTDSVGLSLSDGSVLWTVPVQGDPFLFTPLPSDLVIAATGKNIYMLNLRP